MSARPPTSVLALLAVAVTVLSALLAAGDGATPPAPGGDWPASATPDRAAAARPPEAATDRDAADPRAGLARQFALAARNWTATSYPAAWRTQLRLSTGAYRRALMRSRPTRPQLAALRAAHASNVAVVVGIDVDERVREPRGRMIVQLDERARTQHTIRTGQTRNVVRLRRRTGRWCVSGWSVLADAAGNGKR